MNILIITYSRTKNYGGILQAYGLYKYLNDAGYDVKFIDYLPPRCNIENKKIFTENTVWRSKVWGKNALTKSLWQIIVYPKIKNGFEPFRSFLNTKAAFTDRYESLEDLENNVPRGDIYITGSDQVWNSKLNMKQQLDLPFYLEFVHGVKKISYAPSFGGTEISVEDAKEVKRLLSEYSHISVREKGGQKILADIGIKADLVADPTILCNPSVWKGMIYENENNNVILLYLIKFDKSVYRISRETAHKLGKKLKIIVLNPKDRFLFKNNIQDVLVCPGIQEWLSFIHNSDLVITDSFHACVFSIIFHKKFIVDTGSRKGMSGRITDLLERTGLQDRMMNEMSVSNVVNLYESDCNFEKSDKSLDEYRLESAKWLENAINN